MESESVTNHTATPVKSSERHVILYFASVFPLGFAHVAGIWSHYCQFGPLEWIWRMLTYGKVFKLVKERNG